MMTDIAQLVAEGDLVEPATEIVDLGSIEDDEILGDVVRKTMARAQEGGLGKKLLFRL